jgi:hypothetical protein
MSHGNSPYIHEAADEFLALTEQRNAAHIAVLVGKTSDAKERINVPLVAYFDGRRCDSLAPDEITVWFAQRCDRLAPSMKYRFSMIARRFLRFMYDRGYTSLYLATTIEPRPRRGERPRRSDQDGLIGDSNAG